MYLIYLITDSQLKIMLCYSFTKRMKIDLRTMTFKLKKIYQIKLLALINEHSNSIDMKTSKK